MTDKPEYRKITSSPSSTAHEHTYDGQTLRHHHPGGNTPHGYFGHPEDAGLPHFHSETGPLGCSRCDLAREFSRAAVIDAAAKRQLPGQENWAGQDTERTVASWTIGTLAVHVTDRAHVLVARQAGDIIARLADPAKIAELQDVLEHARVEQARIQRKMYPSALREHIRTGLADGPAAYGALLPGCGVSSGELRAELRAMVTDGELTIVPPSGDDELVKYRLIV